MLLSWRFAARLAAARGINIRTRPAPRKGRGGAPHSLHILFHRHPLTDVLAPIVYLIVSRPSYIWKEGEWTATRPPYKGADAALLPGLVSLLAFYAGIVLRVELAHARVNRRLLIYNP